MANRSGVGDSAPRVTPTKYQQKRPSSLFPVPGDHQPSSSVLQVENNELKTGDEDCTRTMRLGGDDSAVTPTRGGTARILRKHQQQQLHDNPERDTTHTSSAMRNPKPSRVTTTTTTSGKKRPQHHLASRSAMQQPPQHWSIFYPKGIPSQRPPTLHYLHIGSWCTGTCDYYLHRTARRGEVKGNSVSWLHNAHPRNRFVFLVEDVEVARPERATWWGAFWTWFYGTPPAFAWTREKRLWNVTGKDPTSPVVTTAAQQTPPPPVSNASTSNGVSPNGSFGSNVAPPVASRSKDGCEVVEILHSNITAMDYQAALQSNRLALEVSETTTYWFPSKAMAMEHYGLNIDGTSAVSAATFNAVADGPVGSTTGPLGVSPQPKATPHLTPPLSSSKVAGLLPSADVTPGVTLFGSVKPERDISPTMRRQTSEVVPGECSPSGGEDDNLPTRMDSAMSFNCEGSNESGVDAVSPGLTPMVDLKATKGSKAVEGLVHPAPVAGGGPHDMSPAPTAPTPSRFPVVPALFSVGGVPGRSPNQDQPPPSTVSQEPTINNDLQGLPQPTLDFRGEVAEVHTRRICNTMVIAVSQDPHFNAVLREVLLPERSATGAILAAGGGVSTTKISGDQGATGSSAGASSGAATMGDAMYTVSVKEQKRLLSLYETGMPTWTVFFARWGIFYRRWFRLLVVGLINLWPIIALAVGLYDLYKHIDTIRDFLQDYLNPFAAWIDAHFSTTYVLVTYVVGVILTMLQSFVMFVKSLGSFFTILSAPINSMVTVLALIRYPLLMAWSFVAITLGPIFSIILTAVQLCSSALFAPFRALGGIFSVLGHLSPGASAAASATAQSTSVFMTTWRQFQSFWNTVLRPLKNFLHAIYNGVVALGVAIARREASLRRWYMGILGAIYERVDRWVTVLLQVALYNAKAASLLIPPYVWSVVFLFLVYWARCYWMDPMASVLYGSAKNNSNDGDAGEAAPQILLLPAEEPQVEEPTSWFSGSKAEKKKKSPGEVASTYKQSLQDENDDQAAQSWFFSSSPKNERDGEDKVELPSQGTGAAEAPQSDAGVLALLKWLAKRKTVQATA